MQNLRSGFTLIELMVAISIASIMSLTAFEIYKMWILEYHHFQKEYAKDTTHLLNRLNLFKKELKIKDTEILKKRFSNL